MKLLPAKRLEAKVTEVDGITKISIFNPHDKNDGCYVWEVADTDDTVHEPILGEPPPPSRMEEPEDFIPLDPDLGEKMFGTMQTGIDPWNGADGRTMFEEAMSYETGRLFKTLNVRSKR